MHSPLCFSSKSASFLRRSLPRLAGASFKRRRPPARPPSRGFRFDPVLVIGTRLSRYRKNLIVSTNRTRSDIGNGAGTRATLIGPLGGKFSEGQGSSRFFRRRTEVHPRLALRSASPLRYRFVLRDNWSVMSNDRLFLPFASRGGRAKRRSFRPRESLLSRISFVLPFADGVFQDAGFREGRKGRGERRSEGVSARYRWPKERILRGFARPRRFFTDEKLVLLPSLGGGGRGCPKGVS